jgi:hypothetical protein
MIHDGWSPYDRFENARHQQCLKPPAEAGRRDGGDGDAAHARPRR